MTVEVADAAGTVLATVVDRVWQSAGKHTVTVDGAAFADGAYTVTVRARTASSAEVVQTMPLVVSRTLGLVSASPGAFSPNGDGRNDQLEIGFALTVPATVTVRIVRDGRWVASPVLAASFLMGEHRITWDGSRSEGRLRDGTYEAVVEVTDVDGDGELRRALRVRHDGAARPDRARLEGAPRRERAGNGCGDDRQLADSSGS